MLNDVLEASVLYPRSLRDLLLTLAAHLAVHPTMATPTCGVAIAAVLAGLTGGVIVTAGTVQSLLSAEGMRHLLHTVYKTMCRRSRSKQAFSST